MKIAFLGINDVGMQIYKWLCERDSVEVTGLLTEPQQLGFIEQTTPDFIISVGFGHLVPQKILEVPSRGALNLHPSYLPYNRGMSPNVWSIVKDTPAGVTLHRMDAEFDTGAIIAQRRVETEFSDTGKELHQRLEHAQFELFTDTWPDIECGDLEQILQNEPAGDYNSKADFVDLCELDPEEELKVKTLLDRLRALTFPPFNNAYLDVDGERYYVDIEIRKESERGDEGVDGLLSSY